MFRGPEGNFAFGGNILGGKSRAVRTFLLCSGPWAWGGGIVGFSQLAGYVR